MTKRRILLVEDEEDARASLGRALARAGYEPVPAGSVDAALAEAKQAPLDAAVIDVRLKTDHDGGLRLLGLLRAHAVKVPMVVITAFADLDVVKRALNAGASYLLEKPFAASELLSIVSRLLREADDTSHLVERGLSRAALTEKEAEVAKLALKGLPSAEIAEVLGIRDKTVRQHLSQVYAKCNVTTRAELFHYVYPS